MLSDFFAIAPVDNPYYGKLTMRQLVVNIKKNETDGT
jgi:hypothetical protein